MAPFYARTRDVVAEYQDQGDKRLADHFDALERLAWESASHPEQIGLYLEEQLGNGALLPLEVERCCERLTALAGAEFAQQAMPQGPRADAAALAAEIGRDADRLHELGDIDADAPEVVAAREALVQLAKAAAEPASAADAATPTVRTAARREQRPERPSTEADAPAAPAQTPEKTATPPAEHDADAKNERDDDEVREREPEAEAEPRRQRATETPSDKGTEPEVLPSRAPLLLSARPAYAPNVAAVASYEAAEDMVILVAPSVGSAQGDIQAGRGEVHAVPPELVSAVAAVKRSECQTQVGAYLNDGESQRETVVNVAATVADRVAKIEDEAQLRLAEAVAQSALTVRQTMQRAREMVEAKRLAAQIRAETLFEKTVRQIHKLSDEAIEDVEKAYKRAVDDAEDLRKDAEDDVEDAYEEAEEACREVGEDLADEALDIAEAMADDYASESLPSMNAWEILTLGAKYYENQRDARVKAAEDVGDQFAESMEEEADTAADDIDSTKGDMMASIEELADTVDDSLEEWRDTAIDEIETAREGSIEAAEQLYEHELTTIDELSEEASLALLRLEIERLEAIVEQGQAHSESLRASATETARALYAGAVEAIHGVDAVMTMTCQQIAIIEIPHPDEVAHQARGVLAADRRGGRWRGRCHGAGAEPT